MIIAVQRKMFRVVQMIAKQNVATASAKAVKVMNYAPKIVRVQTHPKVLAATENVRSMNQKKAVLPIVSIPAVTEFATRKISKRAVLWIAVWIAATENALVRKQPRIVRVIVPRKK